MIVFLPEYKKGSMTEMSLTKTAQNLDIDIDFVYIRKVVNPLQQQQFLYAVHVADVVIVDCTIPDDRTDGGVYPALTAQINTLNHVIVISENNLPLNITPYRGVYPTKDGQKYSIDDIVNKLPDVIGCSLKEDTYPRLPEDMYKDFMKYQLDMEKMLVQSLDAQKKGTSGKIPVMISYRNSHSDEVEKFKAIIEGTSPEDADKRKLMGVSGQFEIKVLPPASLCGEYEAHTPVRRWMLVGLLEDHIREVEEVWVYESRDKEGNIDYTNSWWTIAEMIMVANINHNSSRHIKVKAYNPIIEKFYDTTPTKYLVSLTDEQHKRLARYLSNTRPDTMGPESMNQVKQLKMIAKLMRFSPKSVKEQMLENLRSTVEQSVPHNIPENERNEMIENMMVMYSDPDEIERYANDDVFKESFWNKISYQTESSTSCFDKQSIDVDKFMSIPMDEVTGHDISDFEKASVLPDNKINLGSWLHPKYYKVTKSSHDRYLWMATRMGKPSVKGGNAPGLETIPIYNIKM
ncbi:MAG: hypothetical protein NC116_09615 [Clostridium sp.]|nr:hypothetical protein [Clostridium sp.]